MNRYLKLALAMPLIAIPLAAQAKKPPVATPKPIATSKPALAIDRDFVAACVQAFDRSAGNGAKGVGRGICECAATEAHRQGASDAEIKAETDRIHADPKYKLSAPPVLAALQYCTINTLRGEE